MLTALEIRNFGKKYHFFEKFSFQNFEYTFPNYKVFHSVQVSLKSEQCIETPTNNLKGAILQTKSCDFRRFSDIFSFQQSVKLSKFIDYLYNSSITEVRPMLRMNQNIPIVFILKT